MYKNIVKRLAKAWSIGLYTGKTPFTLREYSQNPVISAKDIKDIPAYCVADPFLLRKDNRYYMFFEILNSSNGRGEIGVASSNNCLDWGYECIVLKEKFHLSYPYVVSLEDNYYMIPESKLDKSVRLYKATDFPYEWKYEYNLLEGEPYRDSTIFEHNGIWWLYTTSGKYRNRNSSKLQLFYSDDLRSKEWIEHRQSPVITGRYGRPAGRVLKYNDRIYRFSQDLIPNYGDKIIAYEVTTLTKTKYDERILKINPYMEGSGYGWNANRMHHVDYLIDDNHNWIVVADGYSEQIDWRPKIVYYRLMNKLNDINI